MKVSGDVYAEFVLSRIPLEIRTTLSQEQFLAFKNALSSHHHNTKHQIDIRLRIPFYFASYYLVVFGGRDRRRSVRDLELSRIQQFPLWVRMTIYTIALSSIFFALFSVVFTVLYLTKSFMGIDLTPWHLYDIIPLEIFNFGSKHA